MRFKINKHIGALTLPFDWDKLADDYFQTRVFLNYTECYNPCKQRYYTLSENGIFKVGLVIYQLKIDVATYIQITSPLKMKVVGIPCSVSCSGIVGDAELYYVLIEEVKRCERGFILFLNSDYRPKIADAIIGRTLPTLLLEDLPETWDNYLEILKSRYRRRIKILSIPFKNIISRSGYCSSFNDSMYAQYLEVLDHSKGKLEILTHDFFKNLPPNFVLTAFYSNEELIGWYITSSFNSKFYFFMGGICYNLNSKYNTYFNILLEVLKEGIEFGASVIDLGQTAEIPKSRLGGIISEKYMLMYHSNIIVRRLLSIFKGALEYSTVVPHTHVFK